MKVLVFGSANIDRTYKVAHFVHAGETLSADEMEVFCGGKGFNQAIAFVRAGSKVYFAGSIGEDGRLLLETLEANGVNTDCLKRVPGSSGHAIIQVTPEGQNSIIILAGANGMIGHEDVDEVLSQFAPGDLIVLQNEVSCVDYMIERAKAKGLIVALNPSPFNEKINTYDLSKVDYLLVNEVEGGCLTGSNDPLRIAEAIHKQYPGMNVLLTLGEEGSLFVDKSGEKFRCGIYETEAVDTTAAGDTFTGYFLTEYLSSGNAGTALETASVASGISVSRPGASQSIPFLSEVRGCKVHG